MSGGGCQAKKCRRNHVSRIAAPSAGTSAARFRHESALDSARVRAGERQVLWAYTTFAYGEQLTNRLLQPDKPTAAGWHRKRFTNNLPRPWQADTKRPSVSSAIRVWYVSHLTGWVSEWSKDPVLKTGVGVSLPWVRIPPHPLCGIVVWSGDDT